MATFTLTPPSYGKVVGRFIVGIGDGVDADVYPDGAVPTGTVTFTPSVTKVLVANGSPDPFTFELQPITATLDSSGYLTFNNQSGVWLVATNDTTTNPSGFTYSVQYNISYSGGVIDKSKFDISVPTSSLTDSSTWTDLSKVSPVPSSAGNAIVVGPAGQVTDLTIGVVQSGPTAAASITGTAPAKQLNLTIPTAVSGGGGVGTVTSVNGNTPDGSGNVTVTPASLSGFLDTNGDIQLSYLPNLWGALPSGLVAYNREVSGSYPQRPTARTDIMVLWYGPDAPTVVSSGTAGMINGVDSWFQTAS